MSDLISRQAAIGAVQSIERLATLPDNDAVVRMSAVEYVLYHLPSAWPERKKGEWTPTYSDCGDDVWVVWKCSECGYVRKKGWDHTNGGEKPDALFCEMCNADMRGEQNE